jgi:prolipoprotein diacylglyceryl transferase
VILAINWTVDSEIIDGWRTPNLYGLLFVTGLILGYFVVKRMFKQEQISDELLDKLVWFMIPATVIGARLGHVFFYGPLFDEIQNGVVVDRGYLSHPADIFKIWEGGLASHGAAIAIIVTMYYIKTKVLQRPLLWILDRIVIPVASGAVFIRLGNFMNSEIFGKVTSEESFMAMKFVKGEDNLPPQVASQLTNIPDGTQAYNAIAKDVQFKGILDKIPYRYPAQLFEAILYIPVFFILFYMY